MQFRFAPCALALVATSLFAASARAQCTDVWLPGWGVPGIHYTNGEAVLWDPDGAGPATELVVVIGGGAAGDYVFAGLPTWDPVSGEWGSLDTTGIGVSLPECLLVTSSGELVVGGYQFDGVGSHGAVARWDGTQWQQLGLLAGTNYLQYVVALAELPNGDLVAAGSLTDQGHIARWDGAQWVTLGVGFDVPVTSLAVANGELYASGWFTSSGATPLSYIARFDGGQWQDVGGGFDGHPPLLDALPNGDLVAVGSFAQAGGVPVAGVAFWDGVQWSDRAFPGTQGAESVSVLGTGEVVIGARNGTLYLGVGANWSPIAAAATGVRSVLRLANGRLLAVGEFAAIDGTIAQNIALFDGVAWQRMADGFNSPATAMIEDADGDLVVGGYFGLTPDGPSTSLVQWDGVSWSSLGGIEGAPSAMLVDQQGDLVVGGGGFVFAGASGNPLVARWDGAAWSAVGAGLDGNVQTLLQLPNGDLLAGGWLLTSAGASSVARWNGVSWTPVGQVYGTVYSLALAPDGDIYAGGDMVAGSATIVARWDGASWNALVGPAGESIYYGEVRALSFDRDGALLIGGDYSGPTFGRHLLRWDGSQFLPMPGHAFWNGVCGLSFVGDQLLVQVSGGLARYRDGVVTDATPFQGIESMCVRADGELVVSGMFAAVDGMPSAYLARKVPTCPPASFVIGAGCVGSNGTPTTSVEGAPWLGTTLTTRTDNLPSSGLALVVHGFATQFTPLFPLLPQAAPGCDLLITPDVVDLAVASGGALSWSTPLPSDSALGGAQFYQQVVAFELSPTLDIVDVTTANAVGFALGIFAD